MMLPTAEPSLCRHHGWPMFDHRPIGFAPPPRWRRMAQGRGPLRVKKGLQRATSSERPVAGFGIWFGSGRRPTVSGGGAPEQVTGRTHPPPNHLSFCLKKTTTEILQNDTKNTEHRHR